MMLKHTGMIYLLIYLSVLFTHHQSFWPQGVYDMSELYCDLCFAIKHNTGYLVTDTLR